MSHISEVTNLLLLAANEVPETYFMLPTADQKDAIYRERVYCYELYHRWRTRWKNDLPFSIGGEVDKSDHQFITRALKPDFIVHNPGSMENLLVVEVKSASEIHSAKKFKQVIKDLETLTYFRKEITDRYNKPANYEHAYFWIYGLYQKDWPGLRDKILSRVDTSSFQPSLISCYLHERPRSYPICVPWH